MLNLVNCREVTISSLVQLESQLDFLQQQLNQIEHYSLTWKYRYHHGVGLLHRETPLVQHSGEFFLGAKNKK